MAEINFLKGQNVLVKVDGDVIGGISRAVCTCNTAFEDVKQFLTDVPVCRIRSDSHTIELTMNTQAKNPLKSAESFELEFVYENCTEVFTECSVKQIKRTVNAKGNAEDIVTINAEMRNVK